MQRSAITDSHCALGRFCALDFRHGLCHFFYKQRDTIGVLDNVVSGFFENALSPQRGLQGGDLPLTKSVHCDRTDVWHSLSNISRRCEQNEIVYELNIVAAGANCH